jgi:hypothetical protein
MNMSAEDIVMSDSDEDNGMSDIDEDDEPIDFSDDDDDDEKLYVELDGMEFTSDIINQLSNKVR